jgi:hypothetical protein
MYFGAGIPARLAAARMASSIAPASRTLSYSVYVKIMFAPYATMKPSAGSGASAGTQNAWDRSAWLIQVTARRSDIVGVFDIVP